MWSDPRQGARGRRVRYASAVAAALLIAGGCSEPEEAGVSKTDPEQQSALQTASDGAVMPTDGDGETVLSRFQGAEWFLGAVPAPEATDPEGLFLRLASVPERGGSNGGRTRSPTSR